MRALAMSLVLLTPVIGLAKRQTLYAETATGTLWAITPGGWKPLPNVTVKIACVASQEPGQRNHWRNTCDSSLRVEAGGKTIAKLDRGVFDIDFEAVGGNNGSIELGLFEMGEAYLVRIDAHHGEGDEQYRQHDQAQLFALEGASLREVYRFDTLEKFDPGPDANPTFGREKQVEIAAADQRSQGVPNLVTRTKESEGSGVAVVVLAWNGSGFAPCTDCKRGLSRVKPPPAQKPEPVPTGAPASLIDTASGQSIEPILSLLLAGRPIDAAVLAPLSNEMLIRLRNAPYARHGRPFKLADLQAFFYAPRTGAAASSLLPLPQNPAFDEAMLDESDRNNVRTIIAEQKRRGGK